MFTLVIIVFIFFFTVNYYLVFKRIWKQPNGVAFKAMVMNIDKEGTKVDSQKRKLPLHATIISKSIKRLRRYAKIR